MRIFMTCLCVLLFSSYPLDAQTPKPDDRRSSATSGRVSISIRSGDQMITVESADRDSDLSVSGDGRSLRLRDLKTGEQLEVDPARFEILFGGGRNSLQIQGHSFSLKRDGRVTVLVRKSETRRQPVSGRTAPKKNIRRSEKETDSAAAPLTRSMQIGRYFESGGWVTSVDFAPDGKRFASAGKTGTIRIRDVATQKILSTTDLGVGSIHCVRFSRNGRELVCAHGQGLTILDAFRGSIQKRASSAGARILELSPDGRILLTAGRSGNIVIRDAVTLQDRNSFMVNTDEVRSISWSLDSQRVTISGAYKRDPPPSGLELLSVWEFDAAGANTPRRRFALRPEKGHEIGSCALSADGRLVYAPDPDRENIVCGWDVATGHRVLEFRAVRRIQQVVLVPDGSRLIVAPERGNTVLIDTKSGRAVHSYVEDSNRSTTDLAVAPDGKSFLSAGSNGEILHRRLK